MGQFSRVGKLMIAISAQRDAYVFLVGTTAVQTNAHCGTYMHRRTTLQYQNLFFAAFLSPFAFPPSSSSPRTCGGTPLAIAGIVDDRVSFPCQRARRRLRNGTADPVLVVFRPRRLVVWRVGRCGERCRPAGSTRPSPTRSAASATGGRPGT